MRLTTTTFVSLDGVMQAPGAPDEDRTGGFDLGGWLAPHFDEATGAFMDEVFTHADAFLLGRRTYDLFASWWPNVTDPADPIAGPLNRLPKHVATTRTDELGWSGAQRLDGELATAVTTLKQQPGRDLQVHGSGALVRSLMKEELIDTYRILVFPVVLGKGRRLFTDGVPPTGLRLVNSSISGTGVAMLTYDYTGAPEFGSVGGD